MISRTLTFFALAIFSAALVSAQTVTVFKMTGAQTATVQANASAPEVSLSVGQEVPVCSTVTGGSGTTLFLRTFQGAITSAT